MFSLQLFAQPPISGYSGIGTFNNYYYYVSTSSYTWVNANAHAQANGYELVSIHSAAENNFLTGKVSPDPYIGLNDVAVEGTFVWSDGTPVDYLNWQPGEPNGGTSANGVEIWSIGTWNDAVNSQTRQYIMKQPVNPPTPVCDNSSENTTGTYPQIFSGDKIGQSITADASCYSGNAFSKFSFWSNTNSPTSWTVEIFNGETASGSPIYSETNVVVVQSNLGGYSHVNLGTGQNITGSPVYVDGQVYTFIFTCTGGTIIAHKTGDTYAGGKAYDGSSFQAGEDLKFQIEANTVAPTIPTMGEWALITLGLIVMSFGVIYVMRYQKLRNLQLANS